MNRPFSNSSIWNKPIPPNAELHPNSAQMIAWLQARQYKTFGINVNGWTIPVFTADSTTPKVTIYCIGENSPIDGTYEGPYHTNVPFPANAQPDPQADHGMVVLDFSTSTEWDFLGLTKRANGHWHADACIPWGPAAEPKPGSGYLPNFVDGDGVFPQEMTSWTWAANGGGTPNMAGLIRPEEIQAGVIPHALRFACCYPKKGRKVYPPAATTDGQITDQYAIPEGARLQLDPSLDLDSLGLTSAGKIVAKCMQDYGIILVDASDGLPLYAQNPMGATDWYPSGFGSCAVPIPINLLRVVNYAEFGAVEHLTSGGSVLGYICSYDGLEFATAALYAAHMLSVHPSAPPPVLYVLDVWAALGGTTTPTGIQSVTSGTVVTVTATAAQGYTFNGWQVQTGMLQALTDYPDTVNPLVLTITAATTVMPLFSLVPVPPTCPAGAHWDATINACVQDTPSQNNLAAGAVIGTLVVAGVLYVASRKKR